MEPAAELISDEWSSLSGLYTAEEADFMNQLLGGGGNYSVQEQLYENSNLGAAESAFWPGHESTIVSVTQNNNSSYFANPVTNLGYISMGFSLADSKFSPYPVPGNHSKHINEIENTDDEELGLDKGKEVPADKNLHAQKEREILASESEPQEDMEKSGKRSRSHNEVPKNKRNIKSKKNKRSASISTEEDVSPASQDQTLSSCCSDDDESNNASLCGGASSSLSQKDSAALKSRSSRGTAADPQSLYARRRRERINERLRILQNLVPNGTKVDISTMLEEAVQYVKFLQLQIKLLSSDELWMYAPIAYNGMNIGLQLSITPTKEPKHVHSIAIKENAAV